MVDRIKSLWRNLSSRCLEGSAIQKKYPSYIGCINSFESIFDFEDWVLNEHGSFIKDENDKHWDLDKDLVFDGNFVYGRETCVFVPHRINTLFSSSAKTRGELPQGVTFDNFTKRYVAQIRSGGKQSKIGRFDCPKAAHREWQLRKLEIIENAINSYPIGDKAYEFISRRVVLLKDNIDKHQISEWGVKN